MLDFACFTAVSSLKSSFSACWNRSLGRGRDFRDFRGGGSPNHRDSPELAGDGGFGGVLPGLGRCRGGGKGPGPRKRPPKKQPPRQREQEKPPGVTQEAAVIQSKHDSRPSSALDDTSDADEHSIERDCHQSLAPNHHWTYDSLVSSDPEMMFPIVLMKARLKSYLMLHKL